MDTDRASADRWMLLAGPLFTVLGVASLVLGGTPGEDDSAAEIAKHYTDNDTELVASTFLAAVAAVALLVFVSRLRAGVDDRARAPRALLVAGGTVVAGALLVAGAVVMAAGTAADDGLEEQAQTLNTLNSMMWLPVVIGIAAMLIGAGLCVLRTGILPSWLGWVAVVVGVVSLLGPGGFVGFFVAPLWVGLAGILLYARNDEAVREAGG